MTQFHARPRLHVSYGREAWVSGEKADLRVRVTLDRRVEAELVRGLDLTAPLVQPVGVFGKQLVLELKFADRFPGWFRDLLDRFNFKPSETVKFATSVQQLAGPSVSGSETSFF